MQGRPEFPKMEEEILEFWEKNNIFKKTLEKESPKGEFIFYEGPPTANGKPGIHHLEARAFKDAIPRYRTMRGYHVRRKGGWDTHGLPVEIEVEKQLGLKSKKEVEEYGVAEFNAKCKESVWKYLEDWKRFTRRIGFWVDLEDAYVTYKPEYIESLWAIIKQVWDRGLIYKDYKVVPWCPRCGTGLSSHELAQGYKDVKDLSVTVKFKVKDPVSHNLPENTYLLAWTTTPWTLPGNVGLAVGKDIEYVVVEHEGENLIIAKERILSILKDEDPSPPEADPPMEEASLRMTKNGKDLFGLEYEPLYPYTAEMISGDEKEKMDKAYKVYAADFVTTEDGTGIVHTAVMYGQDDFELGNKVGLPKHHLVNLDGTFVDGTDFLSGRFVRDESVAVDIIKDLARRGLLLAKSKHEHSYPHCWRCKTPVIYYARDSWYIRMSALRDELVKENEGINWEPSHIKEGRFGEWLREIKDWAISRERFWGTPLPIWECQSCEERMCVGSFDELFQSSVMSSPSASLRTGSAETSAHRSLGKLGMTSMFDPHRPHVDEIELKCEKCGGVAKRVKEVMDVWFDSGAMPFAQDHYPFSASGSKNPEPVGGYPADYISEAVDQTRGWFYTLHAVGVLMGMGKAFKNVICLGHLMDADGKKMSKSVGNVVDPWEMMEKYGVDALRMWMYTVNQPGESKNFDEKTVDEIVKKVFMILMNVKTFYEMFASPLLFKEGQGVVIEASEHTLDKWILAKLDELIENSTKELDSFRLLEPARAIGEFVADLSQWYVRRSRDRFKGDDKADKLAAITTLRHVLLELSKLMAPFTPFIAEKIYKDLNGPLESVHLESWPVSSVITTSTSVIPTSTFVIPTPSTPLRAGSAEGSSQNVKIPREIPRQPACRQGRARDDLRSARNDTLREMSLARQIVSLALEKRAAEKIPVRQVLASLSVTMKDNLSDELKKIIADEVNVKVVEVVELCHPDPFDSAQGRLCGGICAVAEIEVKLDTNLTPELVSEGIARGVVRRVNDLRKAQGLSVGDVVRLEISAEDGAVKNSIEEHKDEIMKNTIASALDLRGASTTDGETFSIHGEDVVIKITA